MRSALLAAIAISTAAALARADELDDLRSRIDQLERHNAQLQQASAQVDEDDHVRSVVEQYLQERTPQPVSTYSSPDAKYYAHGTGAAWESEAGDELSMSARWNNGLELSTDDGAFRVHVGGRWQLDVPWLSAEPDVNANLPGGGTATYRDGIDFRRARLRIDGTMYEFIEFAMEYDFVNGLRERIDGVPANDVHMHVTAITDLWLQFSHTPIGNLRIGNHKEAIGFEHMVSSRFLPFMERSYNQDTFYGGSFNGFTPGISLEDSFAGERARWNIGLYKPANNVFAFSNNDGDYAVTGRLAWLPVYEYDGQQLVHLGVSGRHATTYDDRIRYRTRDAMRAGVSTQWPVPADITVLGDTMQWVNFELAAVQGPWTFQAEWLLSYTQDARPVGGGPGVPDPLLYQGGYAQVLYFLTGESDNYSLERMAFDRVKPYDNFYWFTGEDCCNYFSRGAWQIGARYNYLDLNDQGLNGGELHNLTAGLNWFLNPNTKWQLNYIATYRDVSETAAFPDGSGWIHGVGMRFAQDF
jgi:phosphate-selective porin OprO/OprP